MWALPAVEESKKPNTLLVEDERATRSGRVGKAYLVEIIDGRAARSGAVQEL